MYPYSRTPPPSPTLSSQHRWGQLFMTQMSVRISLEFIFFPSRQRLEETALKRCFNDLLD